MRATLHNGRLGGGRHNDRQFDLDKANHIDASRSNDNIYLNALGDKELSFHESEIKLYQFEFEKFINDKNARATASRHPERIVSAEDLVKSERYRPEEVIFQLGDKNTHVTKEQLKQVFGEFLQWHDNKFKDHIKSLNIAFHVDEKTPHVHWRRVWMYNDDKGFKAIGQHKALEQMGYKLPNPDKPRGRSNNLKMVYTEECRNKLLEICKQHNLEIEQSPERRAPNEQNLAKGDYVIAKQDQEIERQRDYLVRTQAKTKTVTEQLESAEQTLNDINNQTLDVASSLEALENKHKELASKYKELYNNRQALADDYIKLQRDYTEMATALLHRNELNKEIQDLTTELDIIKSADEINIPYEKTMLHRDKVLIDPSLLKVAAIGMELEKRSKNLTLEQTRIEKREAKVNQIEADAKAKAKEITDNAKIKANSFDRRDLEIVELESMLNKYRRVMSQNELEQRYHDLIHKDHSQDLER